MRAPSQQLRTLLAGAALGAALALGLAAPRFAGSQATTPTQTQQPQPLPDPNGHYQVAPLSGTSNPGWVIVDTQTGIFEYWSAVGPETYSVQEMRMGGDRVRDVRLVQRRGAPRR